MPRVTLKRALTDPIFVRVNTEPGAWKRGAYVKRIWGFSVTLLKMHVLWSLELVKAALTHVSFLLGPWEITRTRRWVWVLRLGLESG